MATPASCKQVDDTFGPYAKSCRGGFDFTLLFEETILSILPLGLLLIVVPFRISYLFRRTIKVDPSSWLASKLLLYAIFGAIQLALVALWAKPTTTKTAASVANAVLGAVGALALAILSFVEHERSIRPSLVIQLYLSLTLLLDASRVRTLWLQPNHSAVAAVTTVSFAVKFLLVVFEAVEKRRILHSKWKSASPEATSGLFSRSIFWWLNVLFRTGFKRSLYMEDLPPLDKHLTCGYLYDRIQTSWAVLPNKAPRSLLFLFFARLKWRLLSVVPPRLGLIAFNFCQPFLIQRAINFSSRSKTEDPNNVGYGLIGAYFLVYTGIAITTGQYQHLTYRAITMARGGLVSMMFAKTSSLKANAADPATSLTLMSADIERITNGWQTMHEIWANLIEIALAIYLLERQLGAACAIPIAVAIVSFLGSLFVMNLVVQRQALWLEAIERRISATTKMLGSMKRIKMCGLADILFDNLHSLRLQELDISKKFRRLLIGSMFFAYTTPVIAPVLTFMVFSLIALRSNGNTTLDTSKVFTSLSLFALLADPLSSLIMAMSAFAGSLGCFDRIQVFLETPEHEDKRIKPFQYESDNGQSSQSDTSASDSLKWSEKSSQSHMTPAKDKAIISFSIPNPDFLCVEDGSFGWETDKEALLSSIQMNVPQGKLTMIVGPVGCGKTTLLKALLGEVPALSGTIQLFAGDVSYCDQSPFHMNGTIRDSITAFSEYDERWYNTILEACALDEDLRQMPLGDQTQIGSKGIALSGGQSQRLALARAAYSRHDLCILDDVLSGLDMDTEQRVFHSLLGQDGLLRRQSATTILASSSSRRLPFADHIVVLNEKGEVAEQGSFKELNAAGGYVSGFELQPADWTVKSTEMTNLDQVLAMTTASKIVYPTLPPSKETIETAEFEANKRTGDLAIYAYYAKSVGLFAVVTFIVAMCAYVFCISFPQIWLGWWAAANAQRPNQKLGYYLGIYAMLGVMGLVSLIISCWQIIITMVPQSGENFHHRLLKTVLAAPLTFFSTTDTGVTLNRFSQDLQLIDMDLPLSALNFVAAFILCLAQIILIGVSSVYAAISFPVCFLFVYLIQKFYSLFSENIAGLTTIRAFGWQRSLEGKHRHLLDQSQQPFYLLFSVQRWLQLVLDLLVAAMAIMLMSLITGLRGVLSGAYVGIALLNVILFSQHLKLVLQYWTMLETHIGAVSRIRNFTSTTNPEDTSQETAVLPPDWPAQGGIEFKSVSAGYDSKRAVLKGLTLSIRGGEKIGICGRTGSGKSSLIMTLFRMLELRTGSITVDGIDLSTLPRHEVRSRIIGLPQDIFLLNGSVRLNIDPYGRATDKAVIAALQDVRLWEGIQGKGGLDADIEDVNLSHGQKQLLCLAQALLRQSSILVLDEATSSLDDVTDALMQRIIRQKFSRHTIIAVAHKLDTITDFDKVAVLDKGTLVELDSPYKLLAQPSSAFSQLYRSSVPEGADE